VFGERVKRGENPLDVELELFGVTHADVGARLLAIWGLPMAIVDVVQFHHDPGSAPESARRLASIVHVADAMVHKPPIPMEIDMPSIERAGCAHLVAGWRAIAERVV
jgi:HD-like signal output (HDOD) protein